MENKKLVIFDFDGVIVNTLEFWFQLHKDVNETITWEKFERMSDGNFIDSQKKLSASNEYNWPVNYEPKYENALHTIFSIEDILHDTILDLSTKYILCICSSASESIISNFLKKENIHECFADVLGYETHSSKVVKINSLLSKYNVLPQDTVFISDTLGDLLEGRECGVKVVGVTWGLHKIHTLEKADPESVVEDPTLLFKVVDDMLK